MTSTNDTTKRPSTRRLVFTTILAATPIFALIAYFLVDDYSSGRVELHKIIGMASYSFIVFGAFFAHTSGLTERLGAEYRKRRK